MRRPRREVWTDAGGPVSALLEQPVLLYIWMQLS